MRVDLALALLVVLALSLPASAPAKGFSRVVLVASDGRSVEVRARESVIDGLLSRRGSVELARGGYLRLFFVGPGDFPANPARYYPGARCVALDWPTYETSCQRVNPTLVNLLRRTRAVPRFRTRPTVLARITYLGTFSGRLKTAGALMSPVELALDRMGRPAARPRGCYAFTGRWRGPSAARRPQRFLLCAEGIYANRHVYPLRRGVWEWFRLNVGPPPPRRFSPRPRRFGLEGRPAPIACCAPSRRPGWFFDFRDRGRGFYVYVYLGRAGTRAEALAILDSLHVQPRRSFSRAR